MDNSAGVLEEIVTLLRLKAVAIATIVAVALIFPADNLSAAQLCWYESSDPPIEHCQDCGEMHATGSYAMFGLAITQVEGIDYWSEFSIFGTNYRDDCDHFDRIAAILVIDCFGDTSHCYVLDLYNSGWRPYSLGYRDGYTKVTLV